MIDEKVILNRLELLSAIEPDEKTIDLAMGKLRQRLSYAGVIGPTLTSRTFSLINRNKITKYAAAVLIFFVVLSLAYAASRVIKYFLLEETKHIFQYDEKTYKIGTTGGYDVAQITEQDISEAVKLIKQGKAKQIGANIYRVELENGKIVKVNWSDSLLKTEEESKSQLDEIKQLQKAGYYERTYKPEQDFVDENGILNRSYEDSFILSDGQTVVVAGYEKIKE